MDLFEFAGFEVRRQLVGEWLRRPHYPGTDIKYKPKEIMWAYQELAEDFYRRNTI